MGYHFDEDTTLLGHPVQSVLSCLKQVHGHASGVDQDVASTCLDLGLLRQDPCDPDAFLLTDAGNRVRSGKIGHRIPYDEARQKLEIFMERLCGIYEDRRPEDGIIDFGWIAGSIMRGEPTIGDIDICISTPSVMKWDPFISELHIFDLTSMAIPCQEIRITCEQGMVGWELVGAPGLHPSCTSLEDPPGIETLGTDQGFYRTGTPDEDTVMRVAETIQSLLECDSSIPDGTLATLHRDLVARYTGGCNASEPAATLLEPLQAWARAPDAWHDLRAQLMSLRPQEEEMPAPGF